MQLGRIHLLLQGLCISTWICRPIEMKALAHGPLLAWFLQVMLKIARRGRGTFCILSFNVRILERLNVSVLRLFAFVTSPLGITDVLDGNYLTAGTTTAEQ